MEPATITVVSQLGIGGIIFYIWFNDWKRIEGLIVILKDQVEDKEEMRADRTQLINVIEKQAMLIARAVTLLDRMEQRQGRVMEKVVE